MFRCRYKHGNKVDGTFLITVLSRASAHTRANTLPPILTVLWFFRVLRVTAHHAKFLHSESKGGFTLFTDSEVWHVRCALCNAL